MKVVSKKRLALKVITIAVLAALLFESGFGYKLAYAADKAARKSIPVLSESERREKLQAIKAGIRDELTKTVSLAAVGDALIHEMVLNSGKKKDGSYNYDGIFKNIKGYLESFDVKVINQETIFVKDKSKFGGYPCFGTPVQMGDAMRKAGFNVITCATNHAYDKGMSGIRDTVEYWKQYEDSVLMTGIYTSEEDYKAIPIREYNGIKIAFLNYTTLVNSGSKRDPYTISFYSKERVEADIRRAKKKADIVAVFPHWGIEYEHEPSPEQQKMAKQMAAAGADLIIGCHPHVVQPLKLIKTDDGRTVPCYYSLGNFVSNMFFAKRQLGGLAEVKITKRNGKAKITEAKFTPILNYISSDDTKFTVYLLEDLKGEVCSDHYMNVNYAQGLVTYKSMMSLFNSIGSQSLSGRSKREKK